MLISKRNIVSVILACLAIAAIVSPASAVVEAGVVGAGIHRQYGPQDAGGNYLGIAAESYDFYTDFITDPPPTGWGNGFPTWSGTQRPPDGIGYGYVLLAFDPYTGEVWNDIPAQHQLTDPASTNMRPGGNTSADISGVDAGGNPITSDFVVADMGRGYTEDTVYITGEFIPRPHDGITWEPFGAFVYTSPDGGILSTTGWPTYATGGAALMQPGDEVRTYAAADPDRPNCYDPGDTGDLTFDQTKTWGHTGFWDWGWGLYSGTNGGAADNLYGFEMDGMKGWMRLDFAADRTGIRLTEYYFDAPAFDPGDVNEDGVIDADDIDLMGEYIRTSIAPTTANYDLSADGTTGGTDSTVDILDLDYLIRFLVETDMVDPGTEYGDFNLDGLINTTDLTILATNYGPNSLWAQGNANGYLDTVVNTTDLTILGTYFGFDASVDTIPEPASAGLLLLGASAVLRRRRKA